MKKLCVAFIVGEFPEKIGSFISDQINSLVEGGVHVEVFSVFESKAPESQDQWKKLKCKNVHFFSIADKKERVIKALPMFMKNFHRYPQIIKSFNILKYGKVASTLHPFYCALYFLKHGFEDKFDIIHCHFGQRGVYGALLREVDISGKLVTSFYGGDVSSFPKRNGITPYKTLFSKGDLFLPIAKSFKPRLVNLGCDERKIKVQHLGVNKTLYKKKKHKVLTVLSIARLVEKKGHEYLIKALATLDKKVKCIIVGDGPLMESLKKLSKDLKVDVDFVGSSPYKKLKDFYNKADIFVTPSVTAKSGDVDGTSIVLLEAQAAGIPVISTLHSGNPEVIEEGVTGFVVPEKDVPQLAERLNFLIKNPKLRYKMGKNGQHFVNKKFTTPILTKKLIKKYYELLNKK